jgi:hypothetical protein
MKLTFSRSIYAFRNVIPRRIHGRLPSPKYINNQQMYFSIYNVIYSQNSHQQVSAVIPAILRVTLLYKNTKIQMLLTVTPSLQMEGHVLERIS